MEEIDLSQTESEVWIFDDKDACDQMLKSVYSTVFGSDLESRDELPDLVKYVELSQGYIVLVWDLAKYEDDSDLKFKRSCDSKVDSIEGIKITHRVSVRKNPKAVNWNSRF